MHYYTKHIKDYKTDTAHLNLLEHGVYNSLIDLYILTENPLEPNLQKLCRLVHAKTDDEIKAVENILDEFFIESDDGYRQKKCDQELIRIFGKSESARKSAKQRWGSERNANAMQTDSERNAKAMLPKTQDPLPNNPIPKKDLTALVSELKGIYPNADMSVNKLTDWFSRKYFTNTETKKKVDINLAYLTLVVKKTKEYVSWYESDKSDFKPQHKLLTTFLNQESWDRDYGGVKVDRVVIANKLAHEDNNFYNLTKEEQNERINSYTE